MRRSINLKSLKSSIFTAVLLTFYATGIMAQTELHQQKQHNSFFDRVCIGGALGFSLGTYSSMVDVSPTMGYALTDDLIAGIGLTYKYYRYKDYFYNTNNNDWVDLTANIYGGSVWLRYFLTKTETPIIENLFIHGEIEPLTFINEFSYDPQGDYADRFQSRFSKKKDRINLTGVFLGGGLSQPISNKSYMYIEVLWNFNEELYSPYTNPRIRIGVSVGL